MGNPERGNPERENPVVKNSEEASEKKSRGEFREKFRPEGNPESEILWEVSRECRNKTSKKRQLCSPKRVPVPLR